MKILARPNDTWEPLHLDVRSNPFGALHMGPSITITNEHGIKVSYETISDFLDNWEILGSRQIQIPVPFLRDKVGLGTVAGKFFAFFHVYPTENCGCPDRKQWWNWLMAFIPFGYKEPATNE